MRNRECKGEIELPRCSHCGKQIKLLECNIPFSGGTRYWEAGCDGHGKWTGSTPEEAIEPFLEEKPPKERLENAQAVKKHYAELATKAQEEYLIASEWAADEIIKATKLITADGI